MFWYQKLYFIAKINMVKTVWKLVKTVRNYGEAIYGLPLTKNNLFYSD